MPSTKIVVATNAQGVSTATATEATISDIFTTALSSDSAVTGTYGLVQRGLLFAGGMATQSYLKTGSFNFLKGN